MYVNLHNHSCYSILDGLSPVEKIVRVSKDYSCPAVAITDHGNLHCIPEFFEAAKKIGQKPIFGCEVYIAPDYDIKERYFHLCVFAKNRVGYKNLCKLITKANIGTFNNGIKAFHYKPRIDFNWLVEHKEGLIITSACVSSELSYMGNYAYAVMNGDYQLSDKEKALKSYLAVISKFKAVFGDDYYIEIMHDDMGGEIGERQRIANEMANRWATPMGVKMVGTCDSHYLMAEDKRDHQTLLDINTNQLYYAPDESKRMVYKGDFHFKDPMEFLMEFGQDIAANTVEIGNKVENYSPYEDKFVLPAVRIPGTEEKTTSAKTAYEVLETRSWNGFSEKMMDGKLSYATIEQYEERLKYELSVFEKMELSAYPLALLEIIDFARSNGVPVGPGRGSSSGSLLCYLVGITQVDPLRFGLIFERFLNPDRVSMPDIDTDFGIFGRQKVIQFIRDNWGEDYVSLICTFNTYGLRGAVQAICRIMEIPHSTASAITKTISEDDLEATWDSSYEKYPEFKSEVNKLQKPYRDDLEKAVKAMFGKPSNLGIHAAGVLISSKPISEVAPLVKAKDGVAVQYSFDFCEKFGLLKMDILGNRNLDVIYETCRLVGIKDPIDIPLDDAKAYQTICKGRLAGMFQIEKSKQFKEVCIRLQPTEFEEIVDLVSLYRPGPIENGDLERYVKRKKDPEYEMDTTISHPVFRDIVSTTRFCVIYQEQILNIAKSLAGYTYGRADDLRSGIGKKIKEKVEAHRTTIIDGLQKHSNFSEADALKIWELIVTSARYSWNKAHGVAYGYITYWTAYLSANYPGEFFSAYCNCDIDQDKQRTYISESKSRGISVSVPNINKSGTGYVYTGNTIYYGIQAVRGIGENTAKLIVQERDKNGDYLSVDDFRKRIPSKACNIAMLLNLIGAGAFDSIHGGRGSRQNLYGQTERKDYPTTSFQNMLIGNEVWTNEAECKALGMPVSSNPLDQFSDEIKAEGAFGITELLTSAEQHGLSRDDIGTCRIAGILTSMRKTVTKKSKRAMAFGTLMDPDGEIVDVVFFPDAFEPVASWLAVNKAVIVAGELEDKQGQGAGTANLKAKNVIQLGQRQPYCVAFTVSDAFQAAWYGSQALAPSAGLIAAKASFSSSILMEMVPEGQRYVPVMREYPNFAKEDVKFIY